MSGTVFGKWYWSDWMSDPGVRASSYAARGLWMDMLCIMAQAEPVGSLVLNGRGVDAAALARLTGGAEIEVENLLAELEKNGVFARDRHGNVFNRRMKKDQKKAKTAAKNGKMGGNPTLRIKREISASVNPPVKPEDKGGDTPHGNKPEARSHIEASASIGSETRQRVVEAFFDIAPNRLPPDTNRVVVWLNQGHAPDVIVAVVREGLARKPDVGSLNYFDRRLAEASKGKLTPQATAPKVAADPEQDRRHRLRCALDHFRGEWRAGTPDEYRPGSPTCTTDETIIDEARRTAAAERGEGNGREAA